MRVRWLSVVTMATLAVGCGGDGDDPDPMGPDTPNGSMTATVDGNAWAAVQIQAIRSNGFIAISGSDTDLVAVGFAVQDMGTGTYTIGQGSTASANVIEDLSDTWTANSFQGSGSITISTLTETGASGTFSYTALPTTGSGDPPQRVVTNGQFDITFN